MLKYRSTLALLVLSFYSFGKDTLTMPILKEKKLQANVRPPFLGLGLTKIERAILMVEWGGKPTTNPGNIRNRDLSYKKYATTEEGVAAFKKLIRTKYCKCLTLPDTLSVHCISSKYSENKGEHAKRVLSRLKKLK